VVGVQVGEKTLQTQVVGGERNSYKRLHFGLGNATYVTKLFIFWPRGAGKLVRYYGIAANQLLTFMDIHSPHKELINTHRGFKLLSSRGPYKTLCPPDTQRLKPSFYILGAWKAGTTSLSATLGHHSQILPATTKENYYFHKYYPDLPIEWYWTLFPCGNSLSEFTFDGTAGNFFYPEIPALAKKFLPDIKLVYMLREPASRAFSHFKMGMANVPSAEIPKLFDVTMREQVQRFKECETKFGEDECAGRSNFIFLSAGMYYFSIKRWLVHYPWQKFFFTHMPDMWGNRSSEILGQLQTFLGLEVEELTYEKVNRSTKQVEMLDATLEFLKEFYKPYNLLLYHLLPEIDFQWNVT